MFHANPSKTVTRLMKYLKIALVGIVLVLSSVLYASAQFVPNFSLKDLDGKTVSLTDFGGKAVLVNFWASWCPPCRKEIPLLINLHNQHHRGLVILGIDTFDQEANARAFAKQMKIPYTILLDRNNTIASRYAVRGLPTSFIIAPVGVIFRVYVGFKDGADFQATIVNDILKILPRAVESKGKITTTWARLKRSSDR